MKWILAIPVLLSSIATSYRAHAAPADAPSRPALLTSIHMVSRSNGWGLTQGAILRTVDGGADWLDVTPPGLPRGTVPSSNFVSVSWAWVATLSPTPTGTRPTWLTVFHTTDGGRTWRRSATPVGKLAEYVGSVDFVTSRIGWIMLIRDVGAGQMYFDIFRTTDSGAHWSRVSRSGRAPGALPSCDCTHGIVFEDATTGWATGDYFAGPPGVFLFVTRDAGRTWWHRDLAIPARFRGGFIETQAPTFFTARTGILPVGSTAGRNGSIVELFVTRDGGGTWAGTTPLAVREASTLSTFPDPLHGWVVDGTRLYRTADGGRHWSALPPNVSLADANQIQFVNPMVGFAVGRFRGSGNGPASLMVSRDGGRTWMIITPRRS